MTIQEFELQGKTIYWIYRARKAEAALDRMVFWVVLPWLMVVVITIGALIQS